MSHVAPTPGAPLAGLQRPLARAAPMRASRVNSAPGSHRAHRATRVPGSQSPELIQPRRSRLVPGLASGLGRRAGYLFALPDVEPAGPPALPVLSAETVRPRVDWAALRALFGIVCAYLSAVARPARLSGQSVSPGRVHLAHASSGLPARSPGRASQSWEGGARQASELPVSWVPGTGAPSGGARTAGKRRGTRWLWVEEGTT